MLCKAVAVDLITDNIRVNCACPGMTATPLLEAEIVTSGDPEATRAEFANWAANWSSRRRQRASAWDPVSGK